tara:strand:+ start:431 stop:871 length:441 start_codon:yes stop_codon:yes gene_type:complete
MNITKKEVSKNDSLSRSEYAIHLSFEGVTPSKEVVKEAMSKETKADSSLCVVKDIKVNFGTNEAISNVFVYTNKDEMKRIEDLTMHKKIEEKLKKAEETKGEEKPAEAPAEEKKEDAPKEESNTKNEEKPQESEKGSKEKPEEKKE